uniref:Uncharacterized protein n=1 Tax=Anguilla anguilla TaxID=7936 RepID=A0A0E9RLZ7_ANGAN
MCNNVLLFRMQGMCHGSVFLFLFFLFVPPDGGTSVFNFCSFPRWFPMC